MQHLFWFEFCLLKHSLTPISPSTLLDQAYLCLWWLWRSGSQSSGHGSCRSDRLSGPGKCASGSPAFPQTPLWWRLRTQSGGRWKWLPGQLLHCQSGSEHGRLCGFDPWSPEHSKQCSTRRGPWQLLTCSMRLAPSKGTVWRHRPSLPYPGGFSIKHASCSKKRHIKK